MSFTIVIITLLLSAFFSGIEIAFVSSNRLKLELDKSSGSLVSRILSIFSKDESNFSRSKNISEKISSISKKQIEAQNNLDMIVYLPLARYFLIKFSTNPFIISVSISRVFFLLMVFHNSK